MSSKLPLVLLVGPTAVGKTELSLRLASALNGEIVSADSRLFYRGMDIGTAKPSPDDMACIPHHLVDVADPDQVWTLAVFQQAAREAISDIQRRGRLPFLVGGTGQYVRAVTESWAPPAVPPDSRLREVLEKLAQENGTSWLHASLGQIDPAAAENIDPRNLRRVIRALEVIFSTGKRFSDQRGQGASPYRLLTIGLKRPRPELYARVDARIESMFSNGFLDEVERLLQAGYSPALPTMSAIGYQQCVAVLHGEISLEEAKSQIKRDTRIFIRRQANWFKENDPAIHWFEVGEQDLEQQVIALIKGWLTSNTQ